MSKFGKAIKATAEVAKKALQNTGKVVKEVAKTSKDIGSATVNTVTKQMDKRRNYKIKKQPYTVDKMRERTIRRKNRQDYLVKTAGVRELGKTVRSVARNAASMANARSASAQNIQSMLTQEVQRSQNYDSPATGTASGNLSQDYERGDDR